MDSLVVTFTILGVACLGQIQPTRTESKASYAIKHLSTQGIFSVWSDSRLGYRLVVSDGLYRLRTFSGGKNASGKIIYRFEIGSYNVQAQTLNCKSLQVFTTISAEQKPIQSKNFNSGLVMPDFEEKVMDSKGAGVKKRFNILWKSGEPMILIDRAQLKFERDFK